MKNATKIAVLAFSLVFLLSGCTPKTETAKKSEKAEQATEYPVTINNIGRTEATAPWIAVDQTFDEAPKRVLANTRPAAELMLHLGLRDHIVAVGTSFGKPDDEVADDFATLKVLAEESINREIALGENPDLIMGRANLFDNAEWGVGIVPELNEMGIPTYVLTSSAEGGVYDTIYDDIDNLGKIFNAPEEAAALTATLKARQEAVMTKMTAIKEEQTFALMFMTEPTEPIVYPANELTFFNDIFHMIKLDNVYKDAEGEISIEMLIETDPDVLIIPDWTSSDRATPEEIMEGLYDNPKLSSLSAIQNKKIYALDYNYMFGFGYIALEGVEILAKEMHPELF